MGAVSHKTKSFITLNPNFLYHSCTNGIKVAMEIELCCLKQMKLKRTKSFQKQNGNSRPDQGLGQGTHMVYTPKIHTIYWSPYRQNGCQKNILPQEQDYPHKQL